MKPFCYFSTYVLVAPSRVPLTVQFLGDFLEYAPSAHLLYVRVRTEGSVSGGGVTIAARHRGLCFLTAPHPPAATPPALGGIYG